jgi:hypothetical protein
VGKYGAKERGSGAKERETHTDTHTETSATSIRQHAQYVIVFPLFFLWAVIMASGQALSICEHEQRAAQHQRDEFVRQREAAQAGGATEGEGGGGGGGGEEGAGSLAEEQVVRADPVSATDRIGDEAGGRGGGGGEGGLGGKSFALHR